MNDAHTNRGGMMELKDMTIDQLGNCAYQEMKRMTQCQRNLQIIEARIQELEKEVKDGGAQRGLSKFT